MIASPLITESLFLLKFYYSQYLLHWKDYLLIVYFLPLEVELRNVKVGSNLISAEFSSTMLAHYESANTSEWNKYV